MSAGDDHDVLVDFEQALLRIETLADVDEDGCFNDSDGCLESIGMIIANLRDRGLFQD